MALRIAIVLEMISKSFDSFVRAYGWGYNIDGTEGFASKA